MAVQLQIRPVSISPPALDQRAKRHALLTKLLGQIERYVFLNARYHGHFFW